MEILSAGDVRRLLTIKACIPRMRAAMKAFSGDSEPQPLRSVTSLGTSRAFGVMPGRLSGTAFFGAKVVSVFPAEHGRQRHQGFVFLFGGKDGRPVRIADAEAITEIRTAATTAVATDALARADANRLAIFGTGLQAGAHLEALTAGRTYRDIVVWGRSLDRAQAFASEQSRRLDIPVRATNDAEAAARSADVLCTLTSSPTPILQGSWVRPGAHINIVGSSVPGPSEVDSLLVARSRFFVDSRESAKVQAAEYLIALEEGAIRADHILAELGEVLADPGRGRSSARDITAYKSLGLVVQDLAALEYIHFALLGGAR